MYKCQVCRKQQPAHTGVTKVVMETRQVVHPKRYKLDGAGQVVQNDYGEDIVLDEGGEGTQIVRETIACSTCAVRLSGLREQLTAPLSVQIPMNNLQSVKTLLVQ